MKTIWINMLSEIITFRRWPTAINIDESWYRYKFGVIWRIRVFAFFHKWREWGIRGKHHRFKFVNEFITYSRLFTPNLNGISLSCVICDAFFINTFQAETLHLNCAYKKREQKTEVLEKKNIFLTYHFFCLQLRYTENAELVFTMWLITGIQFNAKQYQAKIYNWLGVWTSKALSICWAVT